ncbi:E3 SUMO-protein ligase pli1 [Fusarium oxysporum f. sp. rapae]|uniref:E3 SUMO-protein ligase pli1 n=1 Tax=Fusarium oxysporum f. sp. rapae TaxID=485398 RepID=A0A8J5NFJ3_FUSOX|nr:E3 SUMO-protein ligase pli1 [Fusarium oxysporum f. sp. rapae]
MASSGHSSASPENSFFGNRILATGGRNLGRKGHDSSNRHHPYVRMIPEAQSTGTNAQPKHRTQNPIQATSNAADRQKLQDIRKRVEEANPNIQGPSLYGCGFFDPPSSSNKPHHAPGDRSHANQHLGAILRTLPPAQIRFRKSAFYTIEGPVTDVKICDVTNEPRTISFPISCQDDSALQKCINDPSYYVGIFCAGGLEDIQDITFPDGSQIKVDGLEGTASFGRKNKPGSVTPIDISNGLRLRPGPTHTVELTYGPTSKEFYLAILLCKKMSIEEAVDDITEQLPCRGLSCKHLQCFDATTYIQLQEQSPQWECPICYIYVPFDVLAVDGYMENILHEMPKSQERVTIDANGKWHANLSNRCSPSAEGYKAPVIDLTLSGDDGEVSRIKFNKDSLECGVEEKQERNIQRDLEKGLREIEMLKEAKKQTEERESLDRGLRIQNKDANKFTSERHMAMEEQSQHTQDAIDRAPAKAVKEMGRLEEQIRDKEAELQKQMKIHKDLTESIAAKEEDYRVALQKSEELQERIDFPEDADLSQTVDDMRHQVA